MDPKLRDNLQAAFRSAGLNKVEDEVLSQCKCLVATFRLLFGYYCCCVSTETPFSHTLFYFIAFMYYRCYHGYKLASVAVANGRVLGGLFSQQKPQGAR